MSAKQKLELTWIGKEKRPKLEPRILLEDPDKSYHAKFRNAPRPLAGEGSKSPSLRPSPRGRGGKAGSTMPDLFGDGEGEA